MTTGHPTSCGWHVLGSRAGYQTLLASPDLTAAELAVLETLGFGQTDDPAYFNSLTSHPAGMGRPLPTGRYALTRCVPGAPDSAGRRTLLFLTLVFERDDWAQHVARCAGHVLSQAAPWAALASGQPPGRVAIEPNHRPRMDARARDWAVLLADAWLHSGARQSLIAVPDEPATEAAIPQLAGVLPRDERCAVSWAVRALSASVPVGVCSLAGGADWGGRRRLVQVRIGSAPKTTYGQALAQFWPLGAAPPTEFCDRLRSAREVEFAGPRRPPGRARRARTRRLVLACAAGALVAAAGLAAVWWVRGNSTHAAAPVSPTLTPAEPESVPARPATDNVDGRRALAWLARFGDRGTWTHDDLLQWLAAADAHRQAVDAEPELQARWTSAVDAARGAAAWVAEIQQWQLPLPTASPDGLLSKEQAKRLSEGSDAIAAREGDPRVRSFSRLRAEAIQPMRERLDALVAAHAKAIQEARRMATRSLVNEFERWWDGYRGRAAALNRGGYDQLIRASPPSRRTTPIDRGAQVDDAVRTLAAARLLAGRTLPLVPNPLFLQEALREATRRPPPPPPSGAPPDERPAPAGEAIADVLRQIEEFLRSHQPAKSGDERPLVDPDLLERWWRSWDRAKGGAAYARQAENVRKHLDRLTQIHLEEIDDHIQSWVTQAESRGGRRGAVDGLRYQASRLERLRSIGVLPERLGRNIERALDHCHDQIEMLEREGPR